jgi:hypothetical protein
MCRSCPTLWERFKLLVFLSKTNYNIDYSVHLQKFYVHDKTTRIFADSIVISIFGWLCASPLRSQWQRPVCRTLNSVSPHRNVHSRQASTDSALHVRHSTWIGYWVYGRRPKLADGGRLSFLFDHSRRPVPRSRDSKPTFAAEQFARHVRRSWQ